MLQIKITTSNGTINALLDMDRADYHASAEALFHSVGSGAQVKQPCAITASCEDHTVHMAAPTTMVLREHGMALLAILSTNMAATERLETEKA